MTKKVIFYQNVSMDEKNTSKKIVKHQGFNANLIHKAVLKRHRQHFNWSADLFKLLIFTQKYRDEHRCRETPKMF